MASDLEQIAFADQFGPDHARLVPDGNVMLWSPDRLPFEAALYRDRDGHRHVLAVPPTEEKAVGDGLGTLTAALGSELGKALDRLAKRLDDGRAQDAMGTAAALQKVATEFRAGLETLAQSVAAWAARPVVVKVSPTIAATLTVPKTKRTVTRDLLDRIDGMIVEPDES